MVHFTYARVLEKLESEIQEVQVYGVLVFHMRQVSRILTLL
jgi:hypothetical protein